MRSDSSFFSELEGLRGYAFLLVFLIHYTYPLLEAQQRWTYPFRLLNDLAWVAVPVFFVLSGYLITGILLRTRERRGYFRVFYARRALRVFPLYFLVVLGVGALGLWAGADLHTFWPNCVYLQNVVPFALASLGAVHVFGIPVEISHFWSLALEEQFYLLWPLVVWVFRSRRSLANACFVLLLGASLFRFICPHFGFSAQLAYFSSFTRADAVVLGALLALCRDRPVWARLQALALPASLAGLGTLAVVQITTGNSNPYLARTMWRVGWLIPLVNLTAAALLLETLRDGGRWQRACQWRPICRLGSMSYACYAFHLLYCPWFREVLLLRLEGVMPRRPALLLVLALAFALTLALAKLSYVVLEAPAMRLKARLPYGPPRNVDAFGPFPALARRTYAARWQPSREWFPVLTALPVPLKGYRRAPQALVALAHPAPLADTVGSGAP